MKGIIDEVCRIWEQLEREGKMVVGLKKYQEEKKMDIIHTHKPRKSPPKKKRSK